MNEGVAIVLSHTVRQPAQQTPLQKYFAFTAQGGTKYDGPLQWQSEDVYWKTTCPRMQ